MSRPRPEQHSSAESNQDLAEQATTRPAVRPAKKHPRLFVFFCVVFGLWITLLIALASWIS